MLLIRHHEGNQCCNVESDDHWPGRLQMVKSGRISPRKNDDSLGQWPMVMVMMMNTEVGFGPTGDITCFRLSWPGSIFHLIISIRWFWLRFVSLCSFVFFILGFWFEFVGFCISNPLSWSGSINYLPSHYFHQMDSSQMCWLFSTLMQDGIGRVFWKWHF